MATIRERTTKNGEKRYHVVVRLRGHPVESATFRRKTDARKWAQDIESDIRHNRYFKTSAGRKRAVAELIDRYRKEVLPQLSDSEQNNRDRHLDYWKDSIGRLTLADLPAIASQVSEHKVRLSRARTHQSKQRSPATVNRYLATLSKVFSVACKEWHLLDQNPVLRVQKLRESPARTRYLDDVERAALLEACGQSRSQYLYPVVLLALATGMRQGEILGLRWKDLDLKRGTATLLKTKNREPRSVPLTPLVLRELKKISKVRRIDTELVFPSRDGNSPIKIRESWSSAVKAARLKDFRFHDLRHSAASYLAMNGATPSEIAAILGHKTLQMVKRYAHVSDAHNRSVLTRMNKAVLSSLE